MMVTKVGFPFQSDSDAERGTLFLKMHCASVELLTSVTVYGNIL